MLRLASWVVIIAAAVACSDLSPIAPDTCGNGAIDPGEECDGSAVAGLCGAPGDANACHYVCTGGVACPNNGICGADDRCREPSSGFALGGTYAFVAPQFRADDFDGDHITDLLAINDNHVQILYGSPTGDLSVTTSQPVSALTSPVGVVDLDGDGRSDLIAPTALGIVTMLGSSARGLEPFEYASLDLDFSGSAAVLIEPVQLVTPLESNLLVAADQLTLSTQTFHNQLRYTSSFYGTCLDGTLLQPDVFQGDDPDCPTGSGSGSGSAALTIDDLLDGQLVVGKTGFVGECQETVAHTVNCWNLGSAGAVTFDLGSGSGSGSAAPVSPASDPTDEVAILVPGATTVTILTATEATLTLGSASTLDPTTDALQLLQTIDIEPQPGSAVTVANDGRAAFADLDGDGNIDLAVPTGDDLFAIARGQGDGTLGSAVLVNNTNIQGLVAPDGSKLSLGTPRLFADLNGDGVADVVTDTQIVLATCTAPCAKWTGGALQSSARAWTTVVAADLNHDGFIDLAGIVDGETDVDVLLNTGYGVFNGFSVATSEPVRYIATGDFDGDVISDLAIVTGDPTATPEVDQLSVIFGAAAAGPSTPVTMGTFGTVMDLQPASIAAGGGDIDGITDLLVPASTGGHRNAAALIGSSTRQMIAPFVVSSPVGLGVGSCDDVPGADLLTLGADGIARVLSGSGGNLTETESFEVADLGACESGSSGLLCDQTANAASAPACPSVGTGTTFATRPGVDANGCFTGGCLRANECSAPTPGSCSGSISGSCKIARSSCPAGTIATIKNGCYDGYCQTAAQCLLSDPLVAWSSVRLSATGPVSLFGVHSTDPVLPRAPANTSGSGNGLGTGSGGGSGAGSGSDLDLGAGSCDPVDTVITAITPPVGSGAAWTFEAPTPLRDGLACQHRHAIGAADLDGDGADDLLLTLCRGSDTTCAGGDLYLAQSQQGTLDPASASFAHIEIKSVTAGQPDPACGRAFGIQVDDDPELELVAPCVEANGDTWVHILDLGSAGWTDLTAFQVPLSDLRVATGDFNGDHLTDIAVTSGDDASATVTIYLQCAKDDPACTAVTEVTP